MIAAWTVIGSIAAVLSVAVAAYAFVRSKRSQESEQAREIVVSYKCNVFLWKDENGSRSKLLNKMEFTLYNGSSNIIYGPRIMFLPARKKDVAKRFRISSTEIRRIRREYDGVYEFYDQIGYEGGSDKQLRSFTREFDLGADKHRGWAADWEFRERDTNPWAVLGPGQSVELSVITIHSDYHYQLTLLFTDAQRRIWYRDVKTAYLRPAY